MAFYTTFIREQLTGGHIMPCFLLAGVFIVLDYVRSKSQEKAILGLTAEIQRMRAEAKLHGSDLKKAVRELTDEVESMREELNSHGEIKKAIHTLTNEVQAVMDSHGDDLEKALAPLSNEVRSIQRAVTSHGDDLKKAITPLNNEVRSIQRTVNSHGDDLKKAIAPLNNEVRSVKLAVNSLGDSIKTAIIELPKEIQKMHTEAESKSKDCSQGNVSTSHISHSTERAEETKPLSEQFKNIIDEKMATEGRSRTSILRDVELEVDLSLSTLQSYYRQDRTNRRKKTLAEISRWVASEQRQSRPSGRSPMCFSFPQTLSNGP